MTTMRTWFFPVIVLFTYHASAEDTCRDNMAFTQSIDWRVVCINVRGGVLGLSCDWLGAFCPVGCGLCEAFGAPFQCTEEEMYNNKLELASYLKDIEVCDNCEPPPMNSGYATTYKVKDPTPIMQVPSGGYSTDYPLDPCGVEGVVCDRCGSVHGLSHGFPNAAPITGRLRSTFPNFPDLVQFFVATTLPMREDTFMPQDVAKLTNVSIFMLDGFAKGPLPDLSTMPALTAVRFQNTELTGDPNNLFGAPNMLSINIDQRTRSSSFDPALWGDKVCTSKRMRDFRLAGIGLHGPVPTCLAAFPDIDFILLSGNDLDGPVAPIFGASTKVTDCYLDGCHFTGTIPEALSQKTRLRTLLAPDNHVSGVLPDLSLLTALALLDMTNNKLTGAGALNGALLVAKFANNSFTELPSVWLNLPGVKSIDLADNLITTWPAAGVYPRGILNEAGTLQTCGFPPQATAFNWPDMESVIISRNPLHGQDVRNVFGSMASLPRMRTLEAESCGLARDLPQEGLDQMLVIVDAFACDPGLTSGFAGLISLKAKGNNIEAVGGGPWLSIQQVDFSNNQLKEVNPLWFAGGVLFQDFRGNPNLTLEVVPWGESTGCDSPQLVADPTGFRTDADSYECTSVCTGSFIIYSDSTTSRTSLCRCRAGWFGEGSSCNRSGVDTWSGVGMLEPVPCTNHSSTESEDGKTRQEDCLCDPGYHAAYDERASMFCEPCPENRVAAQSGARSAENCLPCPSGKKAPVGSTTCEDCELGAIAAGGDGEGCISCPAGRFADTIGAEECLACPGGRYQPQPGASRCIPCTGENMDTWAIGLQSNGLYQAITGAKSAENCGCAVGFRDVDGVCLPCGSGESEGLSCPGGLGPEVITLLKGYYSDWPISVYTCWGGEDRCPGGRRPGQVCDPDRTAITCALCTEGKVLTDQGDCVECEGVSIALLILGVGLLVFGCIALYMALDKKEAVRTPHSTRLAVLTLAILLTFIQQLGVLSTMPVDWRNPLDVILSSSRNLNFNPSVFRIACSFPESRPLIDFVVRMAIPFSIVGFLGILHIVFMVLRLGVRRQGRVWTNFARSTGLVAAIFYISIVSLIISPYQCQQHPNGRWTSQDYKSLICWEGGDHAVMIIISSIAVLAPVAFAALVIWAVLVYPSKVRNCDKNFIRGYEFMFDRYKPEAYWDIVKHITRSLLLAMVPILPTALVVAFTMLVIQVVCVLMTAHHMPFRIHITNYLEVVFNSATILFLCASVVFIPNGQEESDLAVRFMVSVLMISFSGAPLLFASAMYSKTVALRRHCQFFICHHVRASGCFAVLLRMTLQGHLEAGRVVWLDSDRLRNADTTLNRVREHTETLLVIGTREIFLREWCVAEMVVAQQAQVPILLLKMADFEVPLEIFIESYTEIVHIGPLIELGMSDEMVRNTLREVSQFEGLTMPISLDNKVMSALTDLLLARTLSGVVPVEPDQFKKSELIVCPDHGNFEGVATAMVLLRMLPMTEGGTHPQLLLPDTKPYGRERAALVFSPGCLESESFIQTLCHVACMGLKAVAVLTDESFHLPGHKEVELRLSHWDIVANQKLDARRAREYLNELLKEIAVHYNVTKESDVELMKIAMRIYVRAFQTDRNTSVMFARPSEISNDNDEVSRHMQQMDDLMMAAASVGDGPSFMVGNGRNTTKSLGGKSSRKTGSSIRSVISDSTDSSSPTQVVSTPNMHINSETEAGSHHNNNNNNNRPVPRPGDAVTSV